MVSIALAAGLKCWAAALVTAFAGISRIGEPLRAVREHLLLPADMLSVELDRAYLKVTNPKTERRGGGKTQHVLILGEAEVTFLSKAYGGFPPEARLYAGGPEKFRKTWEWVLKALDAPAELNIGPGGVRGGAAIVAYRSGVSLDAIQWRMRIKSQPTLRAYIQEVAAVECLAKLPPLSRERVLAASKLYSALMFG